MCSHLTRPLVDTADGISDKGDSDQIKTVFQNDQGKKTIDVYWIADDGGDHKETLDQTKEHNAVICQLSYMCASQIDI